MSVKIGSLRDALALLAITGSKRGLHIRTRMAMYDYVEFKEYTYKIGDTTFTGHRDELTPEGWAEARRSRLWKAHEHILSLGFSLDRREAWRKHRLAFVHYVMHTEDDRVLTAFTGAHGQAYAQDPTASEEKWRHHMVAAFKNG